MYAQLKPSQHKAAAFAGETVSPEKSSKPYRELENIENILISMYLIYTSLDFCQGKTLNTKEKTPQLALKAQFPHTERSIDTVKLLLLLFSIVIIVEP